ncbi:MAG TPA: methyltransferase domain-containing protein [Solirubrobacteraceae bacterium]|nr:methyltransferase domain-containing protein [Solirubrobacteraceae bacterium]
MKVSGERVSTAQDGFNPTWQRHVAAYKLCADLLPEQSKVLDLGCGVGHSFHLLAPRESVGLDADPRALAGQERETVAADMRALPFEDSTFQAVLSVQSIEHVPDPGRVLGQVRRVMQPGATAVFVTPNRLTFGRPDEIIDPYHYIEYDPEHLRSLMAAWFGEVRILGIFGSPRQLEVVQRERRSLDRLLRLDPLRMRRSIPRVARQRLYDASLRLARRRVAPEERDIGVEDFSLADEPLEEALDLVAVVTR